MQVLVSSTTANHPSTDYAFMTAQSLFPIAENKIVDLRTVHDMKSKIINVLKEYFDTVIDGQKSHLAANPDEISIDVFTSADNAARAIQELSRNTFWEKTTSNPDWLIAATNVIGSNLATAAHVENLLHCANHPESLASQQYKFKQGQS